MPLRPAPARLRRGAVTLALGALVAVLAACGDAGGTSSSGDGGTGAKACATSSQAGCPAGGGSSTAQGGDQGAAGSCANAGLKRTDDVHEAVTLQPAAADGLQVGDIVVGTGAAPKTGQTITVQYTGWLQSGTVFDSSRSPGRTPFQFALGLGNVIKGWDEGVATMRVGGVRRLVIPPALGYGADGSPPVIPANATLLFDVELLCAG